MTPEGNEPAEDPAADAPAVPPAADGVDAEAADPSGTPSPDEVGAPATVEELIEALESTTAERDDYLDAVRRTQADFENYRKRAAKQVADEVTRAAASLVEKLLPVLDACDGAIAHGANEVEPVFAALLGTLEKEGLERIDPVDAPFDPTLHEAVLHEPGDGDDETTAVSAVLRPGYAWKGQVVRPAMVKVRG